jgi:ATP-dependent protease HslVU (ClpYQ) peptidase subunit
MTCIVGLEYKDTVWMGCDSMASSGWDKHVSSIDKVFKANDMLIGYTTSFRMGQIIRHNFDIPKSNSYYFNRAEPYAHEKYLVMDFIPALRACLKEHGFTTIKDSVEEGSQLLIGFAGCLFTIHSDFSVQRSFDEFDAIGAGAFYALGAIHALNDQHGMTIDPPKLIESALITSEHFCNGVCPPFTILSL